MSSGVFLISCSGRAASAEASVRPYQPAHAGVARMPAMRLHVSITFLFLAGFTSTMCSTPAADTSEMTASQPPVAEKRPKTITVHGDSRVDDYFWLRDKADPEVMAYLQAEDAYAECRDEADRGVPGRRSYKEMVGHIKETDDTAPYRRGDYFYYSRTIDGQQYPIYLPEARQPDRARGNPARSERCWPRDRRSWRSASFEPSDDGTLLAFSTDPTGYRQYTLQVKNPEDRGAAARAHRTRGQRRVGGGQPDASST